MPIQSVRCLHGHIGQMWFSDTPGMKRPPYVCSTCGSEEENRRRTMAMQQATVTVAQGRNAGTFNMINAAQTALPGSLDLTPTFNMTDVAQIALLGSLGLMQTFNTAPEQPAPFFDSGGGGSFGGGGASNSY